LAIIDINPAVVPRPSGAPSTSDLIGEIRWTFEPARLIVNQQRLRRAAVTDRRPVMVFPGLGANDLSTWPLRQFLIRRGNPAVGWGFGVNRGGPEDKLDACAQRLARAVERKGSPFHLIGWSLGGIIARELARDFPELCASVTTFGTPVIGGPRHSRPGASFPEAELARIEREIADRNLRPITVPVTAICSRNDGIVDWRACVDHDTPHARNIEVSSTHIGMGIDPDVWQAVAETFENSSRVTPDRKTSVT
jgi:predicted alpha/beta hydrolase family esterase